MASYGVHFKIIATVKKKEEVERKEMHEKVKASTSLSTTTSTRRRRCMETKEMHKKDKWTLFEGPDLLRGEQRRSC